jgi:ATP-dependent Clp protease protease subunit
MEILAKHTDKPLQQVMQDTDRMFYMNPQEAKEYGIIDRVLESRKALPKVPAIAAG